ncbi:hypothetical protein D3C81_1829700 [compost metagenome]
MIAVISRAISVALARTSLSITSWVAGAPGFCCNQSLTSCDRVSAGSTGCGLASTLQFFSPAGNSRACRRATIDSTLTRVIRG